MDKLVFIAIADDNNSYKMVKETYDKIFNEDDDSEELDKYISEIQKHNKKPIIISKDLVDHENMKTKIIYFGEEEYEKTNNIFMIGLKEKPDLLMDYIEMTRLKKIGIETTLQIINSFIKEEPVYVIINLNILSGSYCPSTKRTSISTTTSATTTENLLTPQELDKIIKFFKEKETQILGLDIIGFDASIDIESKRASKLTTETMRNIIRDIFELKEKKINIMTESSKFLIYREAEQEDFETDIGWKLLRNISLELKDKLIQMVDDKIIELEIEIDSILEDYLITTTTIEEQEQKNYYVAETIGDCCLTPDEKKAMMFELVN